MSDLQASKPSSHENKCSNAHCVDGVICIGFPKDQWFPCSECSKGGTGMNDLAKMSLVKADDMDAINESGAANLLRMNVAENKALRDVAEAAKKCDKGCRRCNSIDDRYRVLRNKLEALE